MEGGTQSKRPPIEETEVSALFEECANWIWEQVEKWDWKAVKTVGIQLIKAADSINANLVEGDGRYTGPDWLHFFVMARAWAHETRLWLRRPMARNFVPLDDGTFPIHQLESASRQLYGLIQFCRKNCPALAVREVGSEYSCEISN